MNVVYKIFFKYNLFLTICLYLAFLVFNSDYSFLSFIATFFGTISSAIILYILLYIVLLPFAFSKRLILYIASVIFIFVDISLVVDFFIYKLYSFHINAMVLNILLSPSAFDSIQIGTTPIVLFISFVLGLVIFENMLIKSFDKYSSNYLETYNKSFNKVILVPFVFIVFVDKFSYGFSSLFGYNDIYSKFKVIPLYQPLTFSRLAYKWFGYKTPTKVNNTIKKTGKLHYPLEDIKIENKNKFNIIIIGSDAARADMITQNISPNITQFSKDSIIFHHNLSGGNATRFGIFSLFYGIHSTYWFSFLDNKKSPVFFDVLKKLNYDISIISATDTSWPEFRQTCYGSVVDNIKDDFEGKPWQRDEQATNYLLKKLDNIKQPFFSFIFMDSPHGYSYNPKFNKFDAKSQNINYITASKGSQEIKNAKAAYKNAIYWNDLLFGKIIKKLKEKNLYDNSLIIFLSDHGQEFYEYGYFGHNNTFDLAQINTPLIIKIPKNIYIQLPVEYENIYTSHSDIVPTILTMLGVKNRPETYSNGYNLFDKSYKRKYLFSANWIKNAIISDDIVYIFSNMPNKIFETEIRELNSYKKVDKKVDTKLLLDIMEENRKFIK